MQNTERKARVVSLRDRQVPTREQLYLHQNARPSFLNELTVRVVHEMREMAVGLLLQPAGVGQPCSAEWDHNRSGTIIGVGP
jgi:hypothetical protein